jgi:hypothetical protein
MSDSDALVLLYMCDGFEVIKSTYERGAEKFRVRVWKTPPGGNVPTGAMGWGTTMYDATTAALRRYDDKMSGAI